MQSSFNPDEYIQYEYILKRTHGLKQLEHIDISEHVKQGIRQFEYFQDGSMSIMHSRFSRNFSRHDYKMFVSVSKMIWEYLKVIGLGIIAIAFHWKTIVFWG